MRKISRISKRKTYKFEDKYIQDMDKEEEDKHNYEDEDKHK